jgi:Purple acid Phosphatase, N-terminal domain
MKKIIIISILSLIFTYLPIDFVNADVSFSNIEVFEMINGRAKLKWTTNEYTRAEIYYGLDQNNLDRFMGYSVYTPWHETVLSGLEKDKIYYFKIKAIEESGEITESFLNTFSTEDMEDNIRPEFESANVLHTTHDAVALEWITNEETRATIRYGADLDNLTGTTYYDDHQKEHRMFVYALPIGERCYLEIIAEDRDGNFRTKIINTNTRSSGSYDLRLFDIKPLNSDSDLITTRTANIKWKTNLVAKGVIYYGSDPYRLDDRVYVSGSNNLNHEVQMENLTPDTNYYYKVKSYDSMYNKEATSDLKSFTTKALNAEYQAGDLLKGSDSKVYVIRRNGQKSHIKDEEVFLNLGYQWSWIKTVADLDLAEYEEIEEIINIDCHPDGTLIKYFDTNVVYRMEDCRQRPFFTAKAFTKRGHEWNRVITMPLGKGYQDSDYLF